MHVILDFDGTVTRRDTIATIAALGIEHQRDARGVDLQAAWDDVLARYVADYAAYCEAADRPDHARTEVAHEVAFQRGLRDLDDASVDRVGRAGFFGGGLAAPGNLRRSGAACARGGRVEVRRGFGEFVGRVRRSARGRVSVLSVSWSAEFVGGVICHAVGEEDGSTIRVVANDITDDGMVRGPEWVCGRHTAGQTLATSEDKLTAMGLVVAEARAEEGEAEEEEEVKVYVGDSTTDLECLLAARGVVMADDEDSKLLKTLRRMGFETPHAGEGKWAGDKIIPWARDFGELAELFERDGLLSREES